MRRTGPNAKRPGAPGAALGEMGLSLRAQRGNPEAKAVERRTGDMPTLECFAAPAGFPAATGPMQSDRNLR